MPQFVELLAVFSTIPMFLEDQWVLIQSHASKSAIELVWVSLVLLDERTDGLKTTGLRHFGHLKSSLVLLSLNP